MKDPFQGTPRRAHGKHQGIDGRGARLSHQIPPHSHSTRRGA